jgi:hypothetical protein
LRNDRLLPVVISIALALIFFTIAYLHGGSGHTWDALGGFFAGVGVGLLLVGPSVLWKYRDGIALLFAKRRQ